MNWHCQLISVLFFAFSQICTTRRIVVESLQLSLPKFLVCSAAFAAGVRLDARWCAHQKFFLHMPGCQGWLRSKFRIVQFEKMKSLRFFHLRGVPILDQLCFEEFLLRNTPYNWYVATNIHPLTCCLPSIYYRLQIIFL
jgi:hypothetical protein